jgi:alpha-beta hydrolase superfamily lysophospholipase
MFSHIEETVRSADGTNLFVQHWLPAAAAPDTTTESCSTGTAPAPVARVVIVHGYLEHCGRYGELAQCWASPPYSFVTTAFDYRGHGKSDGQRGYVWSFRQYHEDLEAVLSSSLISHKYLPTFVLAHSNGALITLDYLLANPLKMTHLKGLIVSSPWLAPADELPQIKIWASKVLGNVIPRLSLPATEVSAEQLTSDPQKIQEHKDDPLVLYRFTVGWALESMKAQARVRERLKEVPVPLYFVYAGSDTVANAAVNKEFADRILPHPDKTVVEKPDALHEVLQETDRAELFEAMGKWILERREPS